MSVGGWYDWNLSLHCKAPGTLNSFMQPNGTVKHSALQPDEHIHGLGSGQLRLESCRFDRDEALQSEWGICKPLLAVPRYSLNPAVIALRLCIWVLWFVLGRGVMIAGRFEMGVVGPILGSAAFHSNYRVVNHVRKS